MGSMADRAPIKHWIVVDGCSSSSESGPVRGLNRRWVSGHVGSTAERAPIKRRIVVDGCSSSSELGPMRGLNRLWASGSLGDLQQSGDGPGRMGSDQAASRDRWGADDQATAPV